MNYLGHAFLSFGNPDLLAGNMIGDYVKGKKSLEKFPEGVRRGIMLHRAIDEYADHHSAIQRAKLLFREDYGLYSGAIIDTVFDHFLAGDAKYFPGSDKLMEFSQEVYTSLAKYEEYFPKQFAAMYPYMKSQNWLFNYKSLKGIEQSLHGLARRAKYIPPIDKAYTIFITGYYQLNHTYYDFIHDMVKFVKEKIDEK